MELWHKLTGRFENAVNKYSSGWLSEHQRPTWVLFVIIFVIGVLISGLAYYILVPPEDAAISKTDLPSQSGQATKDGEFNESYKRDLKEQDKERFDSAISRPNGAAIPQVLVTDRAPISETADVQTCGCTMTDAQFRSMLERNGVVFHRGADILERIADTDIFVDQDSALKTESALPVLLAGKSAFLGEEGLIVDENQVAILLNEQDRVYLSTSGTLIDDETRPVELRGALMASDGRVYLADSRFAHRRGNMTSIGNSDVYVTLEKQLLTLDGKPIRHAGSFVFKNRERELTNRLGVPLRWENKTVLQNNAGELVDANGSIFSTPGILFSYGGILIDNFGKLSQPLLSLSQIGDSDLFIDDNNILRDRFSGAVSSYGKVLTLAVGGQLYVGALSAKNHNDANVSVDDSGMLSAPIGQGGVRTGWLKNSNSVAYDRFGHLISRQGKLSQIGTSDVYRVLDGFLADEEGKGLLFNNENIFLDYNALLANGLTGMVTHTGRIVTDVRGVRLYLNERGEFVTSDNRPANIGVFIRTTDDVVLEQNGSVSMSAKGLERVVTKDGESVLYNGQPVYKDASGRIVDADNNPILTDDNRSLFLNDAGFITDDAGSPVELSDLFTTPNGGISDLELTTMKPLVGKNGEPLQYNGRQVYSRGGALLYDDNTAVLDESGSALRLNSRGQVVNSRGQMQKELTRLLKKGVNTYAKPVTAGGKPVLINGRKAFRHADGSLTDETGATITTDDGRAIYLSPTGKLQDKLGNAINHASITDENGQKLEAGQLDSTSYAKPVTSNGEPVYYNDEQIFRQPDGSLKNATGDVIRSPDGRAIFMDEKGNLTDSANTPIDNVILTDVLGSEIAAGDIDKPEDLLTALKTASGMPVLLNGKRAFRRIDGAIVDAQGNILTSANGKKLTQLLDGTVVDGDGNPITTPVFTDEDGNELSSKDVRTPIQDYLPVTKNGEQLYYNGEPVHRAPDGTLLTASGKQVRTQSGEAVYMLPDGSLTDANFKPISESVLSNEAGISVDNKGLDKPVAGLIPLLKNGKQVYLDGVPVYENADGSLRSVTGKLLTTNDGRALRINEKGQLVDSNNVPITDPVFTDDSGNYLENVFDEPARIFVPLTANGEPIYHKGKKVFRHTDNSLRDETGNLITTEDGRVVYMDDYGNLADISGKALKEPLFTSASGVAIPGNQLDAPKAPLERVLIDGVPLSLNGKPIYRTTTGQLVDTSNVPVLDANQQPVYLNDANELVTSEGIATTVPGLERDIEFANGGMRSISDAKRLGNRFLTKDNFVLDESGKPITHNDMAVQRGKDGFLYTQDGRAILTKSGKKVRFTAGGNLVDEDNQEVSDTLLKNGEGQLLYADGKPVTSALKQIGNSDMYVTRDGKVVDKQGRAYKYDGADLAIDPNTGAIIKADTGEFIRDARGDSMYISESGRFVDSQNNPSEGALITNADGVALTSSGILASRQDQRTAVSGTDFFRTDSGLMVDTNGKPVLQGNEPLYVDEQGVILNANKRQVRFMGKRLQFDEAGNVISQDGDIVQVEDKPLTSENLAEVLSATTSPVVEPKDLEVSAINVPPETASDDHTDSESGSAQKENSAANQSDNEQDPESENEEHLEVLFRIKDSAPVQRIRLAEAYNRIVDAMEQEISDIKAVTSTRAVSKNEYIALPKALEDSLNATENDSVTAPPNSEGTEVDDNAFDSYAGESFYVYTTHEMNTDYNPELEVKLAGLPPTHPLHDAVAYGQPVIRYDNVVIEFRRVCPKKSDCVAMNGIALDLSTGSAGVAAEVDTHFWYRSGGLFAAAFLKGVGEGVSESPSTTEVVSSNGARTTSEGLSTKEVVVKGFGEVGEAFAPGFAEQWNRPPTAIIPARTEMVIRLMDNLKV